MRRPILIGLTGSIGMGKSTTAAMFQDAGIPVWDADAAVHRLYAPGGRAVEAMARTFPDAVDAGGVDRKKLKRLIARDPGLLVKIEEIVHPLVADDRRFFIDGAKGDMIVFDIPLLFEAGLTDTVDEVVVVSAPAEVQRARVLARPGMSPEQLELILARQVPDAEKRARADFVIETTSLDDAETSVRRVIDSIRKKHNA